MSGPGEYLPDATEGITRVEDLPKPKIIHRSRNFARRPCPHCNHSAYRYGQRDRVLHDVGDLVSGRPRDIHLKYSVHECSKCNRHFTVDMSDLALPRSHYTHRVVALAVRLVVEDGLPYRAASWHLWRDHRVFVPWATIQNWVEGGGEKGRGADRRRLSRLGTRRVLGVHRRR
jgi:transposase-like protein